MNDDAEEIVSKFYTTTGWKTNEGITEDAKMFEDLRFVASEYLSKCRLRVFRHIPSKGDNILDMASGPIQYREYLKYSDNFKKRYCVDLSASALADAKQKIGNHGVFLHGSFFDIDLEKNFFDCAVSLHTIYHIDKEMQEKAVRKLLYTTKPGKPVIIVYSNPRTLISLLVALIRMVKTFIIRKKLSNEMPADSGLYFFRHTNEWWQRFSDISSVTMYPWRSFSANFTKLFIPNNKFGKILLNLLFVLEDRFPGFFVKYFQYQMIVLIKKA